MHGYALPQTEINNIYPLILYHKSCGYVKHFIQKKKKKKKKKKYYPIILYHVLDGFVNNFVQINENFFKSREK